jgi:hypothetical protein
MNVYLLVFTPKFVKIALFPRLIMSEYDVYTVKSFNLHVIFISMKFMYERFAKLMCNKIIHCYTAKLILFAIVMNVDYKIIIQI